MFETSGLRGVFHMERKALDTGIWCAANAATSAGGGRNLRRGDNIAIGNFERFRYGFLVRE